MIRRILFLILLTLIAAALAGCNLSGAQLPAAPTAAPEQAAPAAPIAAAPELPMAYVGVYEVQLPAADTPGRHVTVVLAKDGSVTVTSDYMNGQPSIVETGTWQATPYGTVTATLTAQDGQAFYKPVSFTLQLTDDGIVATQAGESEGVGLARAAAEQAQPAAVEAPAPAETTLMTVTQAVTSTAAHTTTVPVTTTTAITTTAATAIPPTEVTLENTYLGIRATASGGGSAVYALILNDDGSAQLGTEFYSDDPSIIELGSWVDNGDGTLTVTLTGRTDMEYEKPVIITFQRDGDTLTAVAYDEAIYGTEGLTLALAGDVAGDLERTLVTLDLEAGFPLDPTFVSVNGGGEVDAQLLGGGCRGFINNQPVVTVHWTGTSEFVEAFFVSDDDPTLVILTPDGRFLCNDDANEQLLDPVIEIPNPAQGTYRIWVGSYAKNQLIPGVLVLTTKPDVNLGTFSLGGLIKRPPLPEVLVEPTPSVDADRLISEPLQQKLDQMVKLGPGAEPITRQVTSEGSLPAFELPVDVARCSGFIADLPDLIFAWEGEAQPLHIYFEGDRDASLVVVTPELEILCNDDAEAGVNINPLVEVTAATPGAYVVFVGRLDPATPVSGTLTITTATDAAPVQLGPVQ